VKHTIFQFIILGVAIAPRLTSQQIPIQNVQGLTNELTLRPIMGSSFIPSRTAVVNSLGQIDGAVGSYEDCVHVDGTSGPCSSNSVLFIDAEVPSGQINGQNTTFSLMQSPSPPSSLNLFRDGVHMEISTDYTVAGNTITFLPASVPQPGDQLVVYYRSGTINGASSGTSKTAPTSNSIMLKLLQEQANVDVSEAEDHVITPQGSDHHVLGSAPLREARSIDLLRSLADNPDDRMLDRTRRPPRSSEQHSRVAKAMRSEYQDTADNGDSSDDDQTLPQLRPTTSIFKTNRARNELDSDANDDDSVDVGEDQPNAAQQESLPPSVSWKALLRNANPVNLIRNAGMRP